MALVLAWLPTLVAAVLGAAGVAYPDAVSAHPQAVSIGALLVGLLLHHMSAPWAAPKA